MNEGKNLKLPEKCPHCGKDWKVTVVGELPFNIKGRSNFEIFFSILKCDFCGKLIVMQKQHTFITIAPGINEYNDIINFIYPQRINVDIPKEVIDNYTDFIEIFSQVLEAHSVGLNYLTGGGMRIAAEKLLDDYLVKFQGNKINKGMSFADKVDMLKDMNPESLTLVRKFGNKKAHNDESPFTFEESIEALKIFCREIQIQYVKKVIHDKLNPSTSFNNRKSS